MQMGVCVASSIDEIDHIVRGALGYTHAEVESPYVFADATYLKGRVNGQVDLRAVVVATGVTLHGEREVLGCAVDDTETETFWAEFFRSLRARRRAPGHLGSPRGAQGGDRECFVGAGWQRCRVPARRS